MSSPPIARDLPFLQKFCMYEVDLMDSLDLTEETHWAARQVNSFLAAPSIRSLESIFDEDAFFDMNTPGKQGWTILASAIDCRDIVLIELILDLSPELRNLSFERYDSKGNSLGVKTYLSFAAETSSAIFQLFLNCPTKQCEAHDKRRALDGKLSATALYALNLFPKAKQLEIAMNLHHWNSIQPTRYGGKPYDLSARVANLCELKIRKVPRVMANTLWSGRQYNRWITSRHLTPHQLLTKQLFQSGVKQYKNFKDRFNLY